MAALLQADDVWDGRMVQARLSDGEHGATAVEYAIMVAAIAAVIVAVVFVLGGRTCQLHETASVNIATETGTTPAACS